MFQARASQWDHRLYNVNRDCAHNFGDVMREVVARLENRRWPTLVGWLAERGVTDAQLGDACAAFCQFVATATQFPPEQMQEALTRCGWFDQPREAQVAVMATLGTVLAGYYWAGVREACILGDNPCLSYQDLRQAGRECAIWLARPAWQRWLLLRWRAVRRWWGGKA